LAGLGLGACFPGRGAAGAGILFFAGLLLAGLPVAGGLGRPGESAARDHPGLARAALAASPVVLVLDCAGWDWLHSNPLAYGASGIEWFPRAPRRGERWGPILFLAGGILGEGLARWRGPRRDLL
ncbi:MAG: hypothetical protein AB1726_01785, partial [Planctomycetota bacterium]